MPTTDAEFVTRIFLGAVGCSVACLVMTTAAVVWAARVTVRCGELEARVTLLEVSSNADAART